MAKLVNIFVLREADDPDYDADLDAATTPFKGSDPFATRPLTKPVATTGTTGSTSVTNARKAPMGGPRSADAQLRKPTADLAAAARTDKPKFTGSFVGQVAPGGQQGKYKGVSWQPPGGDRRFGKVHTMQANDPWVWDGSSWIKQGAFDMKFKGKKRESVQEAVDIAQLRDPATFMKGVERFVANCRSDVKFIEQFAGKHSQQAAAPQQKKQAQAVGISLKNISRDLDMLEKGVGTAASQPAAGNPLPGVDGQKKPRQWGMSNLFGLGKKAG